jgi:hypothetical protein
MDDEVVALLDDYVDEWRTSRQPGQLFLNNHGDGMTEGGFASIFRRLKKRLPPRWISRSTALATQASPTGSGTGTTSTR